MRNNMNRNSMMNSCRGALSTLAGVDNRTMADVAVMNMRSAGADADTQREIVRSLIDERSAAAEDFGF